MFYKWSGFVVRYTSGSDVILKNFLTGAVIKLKKELLDRIDCWLVNQTKSFDQNIMNTLCGENSFFVLAELDEFCKYKKDFLSTRNNKDNLFVVYFLPTMMCQLDCRYCFEKGANKMGNMSDFVLDKSVSWVETYLNSNNKIDSFRFVLFGGEPLLEKKVVCNSLHKFFGVAKQAEVKFWTEVVTNGEFLDERMASVLQQYGLNSVQITLDGPKHIHDSRRCRKDKTETFDTIISNIKMMLRKELIDKVKIRLSVDEETADFLPDLVRYISELFPSDRVNLKLGVVVPSTDTVTKNISETYVSQKVIDTWNVAKRCGFRIPEEFAVGPWCSAIAKHSVVIQPNGGIQKCFCTVGRDKFDCANVFEKQTSYVKDCRFEIFSRMDDCIIEKCPYLPVCGGNCIHDSVVRYGMDGFSKRLCQKELISKINEGLVLLNY